MWMLQKISHLALEWECWEDSEGKSRKERRKALQDSGEEGMGSGRKNSDVILLHSSSQKKGRQALLSRKAGGGGGGGSWQSQPLG